MLLNLDTIPPFYKKYVKLLDDANVHQALRISGHRMLEALYQIPEQHQDFRYEEGKWSIRELVGHLLDAERIFAYRALRFARNDTTPLAGFDENQYAPEAHVQVRSLKQLAAEARHLRQTTIDLFDSFSPDMLKRKGLANGTEVSVLALGFIIAGHETHHVQILRERYLTRLP